MTPSSQLHSRFDCNFCKYNMTVSVALEPWAAEIMLAHAKKIHPSEIEKAQAKNDKDTPAADLPV